MLFRITATLMLTVSPIAAALSVSPDQPTPWMRQAEQRVSSRVHTSGLCRFHIANMFGGFYEDPAPGDSPPQGFYHMPDSGPGHSPVLYGGFGLFCIDASNVRLVDTYLGAKQVEGRWLQMNDDEAWVPFDKEQKFEAIRFNGSNWIGYGTLTNDTTGEQRKRARRLQFCLIHDRLALCGFTPVEYLYKKNLTELPKVKAILQSIEFIDDLPPQKETMHAR